MLDLSKINTPELAKQAISSTKKAIEKNDDAIKAGSKTGIVKIGDALEKELRKLKEHMKNKGWPQNDEDEC